MEDVEHLLRRTKPPRAARVGCIGAAYSVGVAARSRRKHSLNIMGTTINLLPKYRHHTQHGDHHLRFTLCETDSNNSAAKHTTEGVDDHRRNEYRPVKSLPAFETAEINNIGALW